MTRRSTTLLLPLAAALLLAACGAGASPAPATAPAGGNPAPVSPAAPTDGAGGTPEATSATGAAIDDACALVAPEAVATVVPEATSNSVADTSGPVATYRCTWTTSAPGKIMALTVNVQPALLAYLADLGADVGALRTEITGKAEDADVSGRLVDGLGDVAAAWFDDYDNQVHVRFLAGDAAVEMYYVGDSGQDAESKQDAVVEIARAVAARLP